MILATIIEDDAGLIQVIMTTIRDKRHRERRNHWDFNVYK